jgi:hypothetical protein
LFSMTGSSFYRNHESFYINLIAEVCESNTSDFLYVLQISTE